MGEDRGNETAGSVEYHDGRGRLPTVRNDEGQGRRREKPAGKQGLL